VLRLGAAALLGQAPDRERAAHARRWGPSGLDWHSTINRVPTL
jgi:hypothetical protein